MIGAKAVAGGRACGAHRTENGIYLEVGVSSEGLAFDQFLIDPPLPVHEDLQLASLGVRLYEIGGITHVLDMVGKQHYPSPADFLEEGRIMGFSRKVSKNLDFSKLQPGSRLIFAHRDAVVTNADEYEGWLPDFRCPADHDHTEGQGCLGLHYALPLPGEKPTNTRVIGKIGYPIFTLNNPAGLPAPKHAVGMFAAFPITSITVISGLHGVDAAALAAAQKSGFPVDLGGM